jgi:hypothetical protein
MNFNILYMNKMSHYDSGTPLKAVLGKMTFASLLLPGILISKEKPHPND